MSRKNRVRVIEGEAIIHPTGEQGIALAEIAGTEQRGEILALVEPLQPPGVDCGLGEEVCLGRVGESFVDDIGFAIVERWRLPRDLRDFVPPIEHTAPCVVREAVNPLAQPAMVIAGFPGIGDGRDSKNGPPVAVGIVRENETPFGFASRQGASEVSHDRVVVAVADEHDGERTEQLDKEAPRPSFGQVCTAKIGVREHQLMGPVKAPMNVDDAIERPSPAEGRVP